VSEPPQPSTARNSIIDQNKTSSEMSSTKSSVPSAGALVPKSRQFAESATHTGFRNSTTEQKLLAKIKEKDAYIASLRTQWRAETGAFHEREAQFKATEVELRAENTHLELAQQQRQEAGKDPLESILFQKNHDIWDLTQRLMKMQKLHSFASQDSLRRTSIDHKIVDRTFCHMGDDLDSVLDGQDLDQPLRIPIIEDNSDLGSLLRAIFGHNSGSAEGRNNLLLQFARKFGSGLVLRTLCVAAVREWVFASDFPNFVRSNQRLLQAYRTAVMGHGKLTTLS
jgi:hypothetical protein